MSDQSPQGHSESDVPESLDEPAATLVEVEPGIAVLFGDRVPDGFELFPFPLLGEKARGSLVDELAKATGTLNMGAQVANGVIQARGLVRLAPETIKALGTSKPLTSGGYNLGTLTSADGKIVSQIRWLPATGSGAVAIVAALGPAAAMLAIQFQLAQISRLVRQDIELTSEVLRTVRQDQWSSLTGLAQAMAKALGEAQHVGEVTRHIWDNVSGREADLRKQKDLFRENTEAHLTGLRAKRGHKDRREFLERHGEAILFDAQSLLMAQSAWFTYQAIRAAHIQTTAEANPKDAQLLEKVVKDARAEQDKALTHADWLLEELARECHVLGELPGNRTLPFTGGRRAAKVVAGVARSLQESIATIQAQSGGGDRPPLREPGINAFKESVPSELLKILRWHLDEDEELLALADASLDSWYLGDGYVALTSRRLLVMKQGDFKKHGLFNTTVDTEDIRYVRHRPGDRDKSPVVDIITKDENLQLNFGDWARHGRPNGEVQRFADTLRSFMHIPESEIPAAAPPQLESSDDTDLSSEGTQASTGR